MRSLSGSPSPAFWLDSVNTPKLIARILQSELEHRQNPGSSGSGGDCRWLCCSRVPEPGHRFSQQVFVTGHDRDAVLAPRSCHIERIMKGRPSSRNCRGVLNHAGILRCGIVFPFFGERYSISVEILDYCSNVQSNHNVILGQSTVLPSFPNGC